MLSDIDGENASRNFIMSDEKPMTSGLVRRRRRKNVEGRRKGGERDGEERGGDVWKVKNVCV